LALLKLYQEASRGCSQSQFPHSNKDLKTRYQTFLYNFQDIVFEGKMDFTPIFFHGAVGRITEYTASEFLHGSSLNMAKEAGFMFLCRQSS